MFLFNARCEGTKRCGGREWASVSMHILFTLIIAAQSRWMRGKEDEPFSNNTHTTKNKKGAFDAFILLNPCAYIEIFQVQLLKYIFQREMQSLYSHACFELTQFCYCMLWCYFFRAITRCFVCFTILFIVFFLIFFFIHIFFSLFHIFMKVH